MIDKGSEKTEDKPDKLKIKTKSQKAESERDDLTKKQATEEELLSKLVEESINYLDDADNPYGSEKIWRYLNG